MQKKINEGLMHVYLSCSLVLGFLSNAPKALATNDNTIQQVVLILNQTPQQEFDAIYTGIEGIYTYIKSNPQALQMLEKELKSVTQYTTVQAGIGGIDIKKEIHDNVILYLLFCAIGLGAGKYFLEERESKQKNIVGDMLDRKTNVILFFALQGLALVLFNVFKEEKFNALLDVIRKSGVESKEIITWYILMIISCIIIPNSIKSVTVKAVLCSALIMGVQRCGLELQSPIKGGDIPSFELPHWGPLGRADSTKQVAAAEQEGALEHKENVHTIGRILFDLFEDKTTLKVQSFDENERPIYSVTKPKYIDICNSSGTLIAKISMEHVVLETQATFDNINNRNSENPHITKAYIKIIYIGVEGKKRTYYICVENPGNMDQVIVTQVGKKGKKSTVISGADAVLLNKSLNPGGDNIKDFILEGQSRRIISGGMVTKTQY